MRDAEHMPESVLAANETMVVDIPSVPLIQRGIVDMLEFTCVYHVIVLYAQRFALPASGRAWIMLESGEKLEARKMLVNRADSHLSGARFVGRTLGTQDSKPKIRYRRQDDQILHTTLILTRTQRLCFANTLAKQKPLRIEKT